MPATQRQQPAHPPSARSPAPRQRSSSPATSAAARPAPSNVSRITARPTTRPAPAAQAPCSARQAQQHGERTGLPPPAYRRQRIHQHADHHHRLAPDRIGDRAMEQAHRRIGEQVDADQLLQRRRCPPAKRGTDQRETRGRSRRSKRDRSSTTPPATREGCGVHDARGMNSSKTATVSGGKGKRIVEPARGNACFM